MPDLEQAVLLNPAYGDAYLNRGTARVSLGDVQGALRGFYQSGHVATRQSFKALTNRGFTKIILGDPEGALADCNRALALAPEYGKACVGARLGPESGLETGRKAAGDLKNAWNSGMESAKIRI